MPSPDNADRHEALIREIRAAFSSVSRIGGVSWSESSVIDDHGTEAEQAAARASDTDTRWEDVVADSTWNPDVGIGGFSFLDPIGARYYLPAAMMRHLGGGTAICFDLTIPARDDDGHRHALKKWSLLDDRQKACVASFLRYMISQATSLGDAQNAARWKAALDSHWKAS